VKQKPFSKITNQTGKHKDWYKEPFIKTFCEQINPQNKLFSNSQFISKYKKLHTSLELKERLKLIADLLDEFLDMPYVKKLDTLKPLLGDELQSEEGMFDHGFQLYPVSQFIEKNGNEDLKKSLDFIEELTKRFTGEWAIRPLAAKHEKSVLKKMKEWSKHKNFHVRRLSSEGLRPRLPWGTKIDWINEAPQKAIPIYSKLRNDKSLYVRRSVANSMGDILKLDETLAFNTFQDWLSKKQTKENLWVIKHAIRHPAKNKVPKYVKLRADLQKQILNLSYQKK
jgi:3-methyladenine DNA glycosylase AlkC